MMDYRYNNKITVDIDKQIVQPIVVLCKRSGEKIGAINNIQDFKANHPMNEISEISFDVYKYTNEKIIPYWDLIKDFKFVYLPTVKDKRFRWYEITVNIDESNDTIKHITGTHANEAELAQINLYEVEINTADDINRDDYKTIKIDGKEYGTVFYNQTHPKASLLNRILSDKASHYSIVHVDDTLKNIQREFSFNGTSILNALNDTIATEVGCLFVYGEPTTSSSNDSTFYRTISAYDLMDFCQDCGERGNYSDGECIHCGSKRIKYGYGKDTGIFINAENLTESISFTSNIDDVKTFFRLSSGDADMDAAIRNCNPNGSNYIFSIPDEMKDDMSSTLSQEVTAYENLFNSYLKNKSINLDASIVLQYNTLINKYKNKTTQELNTISSTVSGFEQLIEYDYVSSRFRDLLRTTMMPSSPDIQDTTAIKELNKLTSSVMSPIGVDNTASISLTAANSAVKSLAEVYVDTARYKVELISPDYSSAIWNGMIKVTSYTDDSDTASKIMQITFNNDGVKFLEQKIKKMIKQHSVKDIGDVSFLEQSLTTVKNRLSQYSLDALSLLDDLCVALMSILVDGGYGVKGSQYYNTFYYPYWQKREAIMAEEKVRESEIKTIGKLISNIDSKRKSINNTLDIKNYFGDLYPELMLYRRENEYNNSNFISDGLEDNELIDKAREYYKRAQQELIKSSKVQHTISATLYDLFLIPEFANIINGTGSSAQRLIDTFDGGNWMRVQVDGKVYKLRLVNWEIDYSNPENIDVEFSDVSYTGNTVSSVANVLSKARDVAATYRTTVKQAEKGNTANAIIEQSQQQGIVLGSLISSISSTDEESEYQYISPVTKKPRLSRYQKSLLANQNKIINDIQTQNFIIDENGALMRAKNDFDDLYNPEQIKLLNRGIYYTNDSWESVKAGLGHFSYIDPVTGETKEDYGVIASTIIGQLILGNNLKIYSESGKFEMGDDGLMVTAIDGEDNTDLFVVQKQKVDNQGNVYVEKYIYVDSDGDVKIAGNSILLGGKPLVEYIDEVVEDVEVSLPITIQIDSSAGVIFKNRNISTILTATVYRGGKDITSEISEFRWTKKDKDGNIDTSWSRYTTSNVISISSYDVDSKAVFGCEVTVEQ